MANSSLFNLSTKNLQVPGLMQKVSKVELTSMSSCYCKVLLNANKINSLQIRVFKCHYFSYDPIHLHLVGK